MEKLLQEFYSLEMNELHRAVSENRLEAVKILMKNGANIANTIQNGQTPLHLAVKNKNLTITQELLKNHSREKMRSVINMRTLDKGTMALHLAVHDNSLGIARFLLSRGAIFEMQDYEDQEPKKHTSGKRITQLIECIEILFESTSTNDGKTLLEKLKLCPAEDIQVVMQARNQENFTILQLAMERNHLVTVATIVSRRMGNCKKGYWKPCGEIDKLMRHSKAARLNLSNLDVFCHENADGIDADIKKEIMDLLRNAGDFLGAYKEKGDVALDHNPSLVIVEESLEFFGKTSKNTNNENRVDTMLGYGRAFAAQMLQLCIVAPIQFFMKNVYTCELYVAAQNNKLALVEKCLTGHPDMNEKYDNGWSPLRFAVSHQNSEMLQLLLNFGANPTSPNSRLDNKSQLHNICEYDKLPEKSPGLLKVLYNHGSFDGINMKTTKDGFTALHVAAKKGLYLYVELFLARGAIYCAKDAHDKTPKDYCLCNEMSNRYRTQDLFNTLDQLFAHAGDGQIKEMIYTMDKIYGNAKVAIGGARNDEGHTLDQVLELKGHVDEAKQFRELISKFIWG